MANSIIEKVNQPAVESEHRNITVNDKGKYIENVENLNLSQSINFTTNINGQVITSNIIPNNDFYNLFVLDGEDFTKGYFIIKRNEALKYIDKEVESLHPLFNPDSIQICKSYPCIFANKNQDGYKKAGTSQKLYFGYLAAIEFTDEGLKFTYSLMSSLMQQMINENPKQFNVKYSRGDNELDKVHWSIKKINIVELIRSLGLNVAAY